MKNIFQSLTSAINYFHLTYRGTWAHYYEEAEQRDDYLEPKTAIIKTWIDKDDAIKTAIDAGANDGTFSKLLAAKGILTIAADSDHFAINKLYEEVKDKRLMNLIPLMVDFANPTPAIGVNNLERESLLQRTTTDLVLALAFIHHLAIGKNIPFSDIALLFKNLGKKLMVEFVPKEDEKIQLMLQQKRDIYDWYNEDRFKEVFSRHYQFLSVEKLGLSGRTLYLMEPYEN